MFGLLPPGDDLVSAYYSIDGGPPVSRSLVDLMNGTLPVGNATYFVSPDLTMGSHNLTIMVTNTSQGRNYTLDYFHVLRPSGEELPSAVSTAKPHTNVGVILAAVLSGFILAITLTLAARWFWRRRRRYVSNESNRQKGLSEQELDTVKGRFHRNAAPAIPYEICLSDFGPHDILSLSNLARLTRLDKTKYDRSRKFQTPLIGASVATLVDSGAPSDGSASPTIVPPTRSKRGYPRRVR